MQIHGGIQIKNGTITPDKLTGNVVQVGRLVFNERSVGNGSATVFALQQSGPVVAATPRPLEVFVDGLLQDPGEDNNGDYSYNSENNEITFASAPTSGAIILVNYVWAPAA